jgi:hypothetical protein
MKTRMLIIATMLLFSIASQAGSPQRSLTIFGINGRNVEIPVKVEEAHDSVPAAIAEIFREMEANRRDSLINHQFDLSNMSRPEPDADDVTIDTRGIFRESIVRYPYTWK